MYIPTRPAIQVFLYVSWEHQRLSCSTSEPESCAPNRTPLHNFDSIVCPSEALRHLVAE